jgi:hypothetical protein
MILTLESGEELAHKLPCKVIWNAVQGKVAGSHQIGPQRFVVLANYFADGYPPNVGWLML